jgi:hypothetical protein
MYFDDNMFTLHCAKQTITVNAETAFFFFFAFVRRDYRARYTVLLYDVFISAESRGEH